MQEIWKTVIIDGEIYENYEVSNLGKIRSLNYRRSGEVKELRLSVGKGGYLQVPLCKNGKHKIYKVHRLVAFAFIPNDDTENKIDVNHIDEDKSNNTVENLEWCTASYNNNYGTRNERVAEKLKNREFSEESRKKMSEKGKGRKFSEEHKQKLSEARKGKKPNTKKVICVETGQIFDCIKDAERETKINHIGRCCKGKQSYAGRHPKTNEKLHWKFVE